MKKISILTILALALLGIGGIWLYADTQERTQRNQEQPQALSAPQPQINAPTIGSVTATPTTITVNMPTPIVITAQIADPTLIQNSVTLLQLGATGTQPTILGQLQGNGSGTYTIQTTLTQHASGQIQLEISAAFRGLLRRVTANVPSIPVSAAQSFVSTTTATTLSYPADWSNIIETTDSVILENATGASSLGISFFQVHYMPQANTGLLPISQWFSYFSAQLPSPPVSVATTTVDGYPAVQIAGGDIIPETIYYVSKGPDIFEISYQSNDSFMGEYLAILNSITF